MSRVVTKIFTVIQHHSSRVREAAELIERLDGLDPILVTDPGGPKTSTWRTHRLCLESVPDNASHLLVVQDDAWPCDRFDDAVYAAICEKPESILCLFAPGAGPVARQFGMARRAGSRWMPWRISAYLPLVAVVYPADLARQIPAFADAKRFAIGRADDAIVGSFVRAHKLQAWASVPCLVQHRDELASVMRMPSGKQAPHRLAALWSLDAADTFLIPGKPSRDPPRHDAPLLAAPDPANA